MRCRDDFSPRLDGNVAYSVEIISDIERSVPERHYWQWTVWVTDSPDQRRLDLEGPSEWRAWEADTPEAARSVVRFFVGHGMLVGNGTRGRAYHGYIFKWFPSGIVDGHG